MAFVMSRLLNLTSIVGSQPRRATVPPSPEGQEIYDIKHLNKSSNLFLDSTD